MPEKNADVMDMGAERYFQQLKDDRERTHCAWTSVCRMIDRSLEEEDIEALLEVIFYMEQGEGHLAIQYIGEAHRILCALHIIQLEYRYGKLPFCTGCENMQDLMDKYMLTLYALRRLLFCLSPESEEEAASYLRGNEGISIFVIYVILKDDLIHADEELYQRIKGLYGDIWTSDDLELFESMSRMG